MNSFISKKYVDTIFALDSCFNYKREVFDILYSKLKETNICLIGLRQIGKTTLMMQLAKKYYDEHIDIDIDNDDNNLKSVVDNNKDKIFYINIKSIQLNQEVRDELFNEITKPKYKLVIIDEIQEINQWSNFLQSAIDLNKQCKFVVTGSNASELNKELMVGRIKVYYIQPLLYNEYLKIWDKQDNQNSINDYLNFGSYPKSNNYIDPEIQYNEIVEPSIIDKLIINDLKMKPDLHKFKSLLKNINNYIGNEINASEIEKVINISRQTVPEYINMMEQARMIHTINKYNDKNSKRKKKVYYEDKSFIYLFNKNNHLDNNYYGSLIENVVFNYLVYNYLNTTTLTEINYYRNKEDKEIDFIIPNHKLLIECKCVKDLDCDKLTKELNEIIKNEDFLDYNKVIITKDINSENLNGWKLISIDEFLRGKLWIQNNEKN